MYLVKWWDKEGLESNDRRRQQAWHTLVRRITLPDRFPPSVCGETIWERCKIGLKNVWSAIAVGGSNNSNQETNSIMIKKKYRGLYSLLLKRNWGDVVCLPAKHKTGLTASGWVCKTCLIAILLYICSPNWDYWRGLRLVAHDKLLKILIISIFMSTVIMLDVFPMSLRPA